MIVITTYYDMLGSFGEGNFFPGANDNASGTTMVLDPENLPMYAYENLFRLILDTLTELQRQEVE